MFNFNERNLAIAYNDVRPPKFQIHSFGWRASKSFTPLFQCLPSSFVVSVQNNKTISDISI